MLSFTLEENLQLRAIAFAGSGEESSGVNFGYEDG
jgi:hypothetical protein